MKKNVLLVTSAAPLQSPFSTSEKRPPIGIGFLISTLKNAGHEVFFIDNYLQRSNFLETNYLERNRIHYVGIYANTICYRDTLRMLYRLEYLRKTGYWNGKVVLGGPHTTVALETIPDFVDFVVQGEGENAILDIVEERVRGRVISYPRLNHLDHLPMPAWDYFVHMPYNWGLDWWEDKPIFPMNTSRGCPFHCAFCSVGSIWGKKYTFFSAERIISEIEYLIKTYGAKGVYFREDNFTCNRERLIRFCHLMNERKLNLSWACETRANALDRETVALMYQAGARAFYIGVESGSQRILDCLKKGITVEQIKKAFKYCHEFGIKTGASIIIATPKETEEDLQKTLALIEEIKPTVTWPNIFVGIPRSELYDYILANPVYEFIDDRGLVYLKGHNDRVKKFYGKGWDANIPVNFDRPKISVVLSTYNDDRYISQAIQSLLKQTFQDFEFIIVDDASTDNTPKILSQIHDPRIHIIVNSQNQGLTRSLNIGIRQARGEYIARMDADDISLPHRFENQLSFLERNPDYALVGSSYYVMNEKGIITSRVAVLSDDSSLKEGLKKQNWFGHGSVLLRKAIFQQAGGYDERFRFAQDYDLWLRIAERYKVANLEEPLYCWRKTEKCISNEKAAEQKYFAQLALSEAERRRNGKHQTGWCKESPLVSVIVPTYNRPKMLIAALESILGQTYQNLEILVVNDGETDVQNIVTPLNKKGNITYVKHTRNKGLAAARNTGIKLARGKYFAYLDDDDLFYPHHVETLVAFLESGQYKVAYTDAYRAHQEKKNEEYVVIKRDVPYSFDFDYDRILEANFVPVLCFMHESACLNEVGLFDESLIAHEDWDLWIRMSRKFNFEHIKKLTCEFTWREDGSTMTSSRKKEMEATRRIVLDRGRRYQREENGGSSRRELTPVESKADRREGWEQQMMHFQKKNSQTVSFSVVIPAHNNREKLRLTLDCISQTDIDMSALEVVVVDDGSNDGTYEAFFQQKYPFHFKIFAQAFGGQSAATNEAIRQATGRYLLSSAQDILFHKNIFKEHLGFHQKYSDQDVVVLGALPYARQLEVTPFMFYLVNGGWQFAYYSIKDPLNVPPQFLYAPNFSIKREVLQRVGLFDEKFPFGSQDTDLGIRLANAGVKILYNPHAIGYHNHPIELANFFRRQEMVGASLVLLHEKHPLCEDLLSLWDQVILHYLTFSATENDRCLDLIAQLETVYRKREVDYESLWIQFFSHNIALSNFSEADQKAIQLTSVLFRSYDQILRSYWAKGFLKEALQFYGRKKVEEYLRGRLVKYQLSMQASRNANLRLRDHSLDISLGCRDYLISLIVYGINNYRAATDFLKNFMGPLTKAFNYQVLFVLLENSFSQQELAKLQQVADVVLCTSEDDGIIKALQFSEAEIICIITGKTIFDYGQAKANAESYFRKNERIAVLWGNQTLPKSQRIKYTYQNGNPTTPKTVPCANKSELKQGPNEIGIPEFFVIRGSEIQQILAQYHQIPLPSRRHWFEDICAIVQEAGKMVYHSAKLTAGIAEPAKNSNLVSIIILTYNQLEYTKKCLDSIFKYTLEPFELIIVDNGSTDGTAYYLNAVRESNVEVGGWKLKVGKDGEVVCQTETEEAEKVNFKNKGKKKERIEEKRRENGELACQYFKIIRNEKNQGFAKGCNKGIGEARGELLLLLNNDVLVTENWLSGLMECLQSAKDIGVVGPMTNQISGIQKVNKVSYQAIADLDTFAKRFREENRHRRVHCRRIVGFCLLFRRELVDRIGLLDESFGTGNFEDDDFCLRAELAGYRNMIAGDVFVHHFGSRSFAGNGIDYHSALSGNRKKFDEKWNGLDYKTPEGKKLLLLKARESARQFCSREQIDKAIEKLLAGLALEPQDPELHYEMVEIFLEAKGFDRAIEVLKPIPTEFQDEKKLALMGYAFEGLGKFEEAEEWAERALSRNAHSALAMNLKGILAYRRQKMEEAEGFFQKAIEMDKGYGEPYTNLGLLKWSDGQKKETVSLFEKGFILAPTIPDQIMNYHAAVTETAQFARAEKYFREAKALHPFHKRIHFLLIDLLLRQGQHAEAMKEIEEAMSSFGVDEGILTASLEVRKRIGAKEIPTGKNRNSLSLCMIVKNEEKHLPQCLGSVKDLVDEILIVDTGSGDKTREISTAFGAKVFEFPWEGDFSAARNFSLDQARGEWVLILDADERIAARDFPDLRKLTCQEGNRRGRVAYSFVTRNYTTNSEVQGWTPNEGIYEEEKAMGWFPSEKVRLFPNDSRVRFQGVVHEGVRSSLVDHSVAIEDSAIPIHHFGKLDEQREREKGEEYYLLGKKKLERSKPDVRNLRELAVQAGELERYAEAAELWNQVITLQPDMAEAYTNLSSLYLKLKKYDQAYAASKQAVTLAPDSKEALLNFSTAGLSRGKTFESIRTLESLLAKNPEYPPAMGVLSVAYVLHGEKEKGSALIEKLERWGFNYAEYLSLMSQEFTSMGKEKEGQMLHQMIAQSEALSSPVCEPGLAH